MWVPSDGDSENSLVLLSVYDFSSSAPRRRHRANHGIYEQAYVKPITRRSRDSPSIYPASLTRSAPFIIIRVGPIHPASSRRAHAVVRGPTLASRYRLVKSSPSAMPLRLATVAPPVTLRGLLSRHALQVHSFQSALSLSSFRVQAARGRAGSNMGSPR